MSFDLTIHVDAAFTLALSLVAGVASQALARHLRVPGIVILLGVGALLGPDGIGWIDPTILGEGLPALVGLAVAVILFEGGLNLRLRRIREESLPIRRLVTAGALVTTAGATLAARLALGWPWGLCWLFGSLVIVTGPTVVTPLLRRLRLQHGVATVLEAEGVLIDPIGALVAIVTLELVVGMRTAAGPSLSASFLGAMEHFGVAMMIGGLAGAAGGVVLAVLLRFEKIIPEGLDNVFALAGALALYETCHAILPESGILAVTVAGIVVGNLRSPALKKLSEFKEQLASMLIGVLFVLLAADVRLEHLRALGGPGVAVVAGLVLAVRPLAVFLATAGTDLKLREKLFLSWLAPRGIVAAAVASLFASELARVGLAGGTELRALVFLVIAVTVVLGGLTGGWVARRLGVRREGIRGYVIAGANEVGLAMAAALREGGEEVVFLDDDAETTRAAQEAGFRVVFGNAIEERTLLRAEADSRAGCIAATTNPEANLLVATAARKDFKVPRVWVAVPRDSERVTAAMVEERGGRVLFGGRADLASWGGRLGRGTASIETWRLEDEDSGAEPDPPREKGTGAGREGLGAEALSRILLPLLIRRGEGTLPFDASVRTRRGDRGVFLVDEERREEARAWLTTHGWIAVEAAREEPGSPEAERQSSRA